MMRLFILRLVILVLLTSFSFATGLVRAEGNPSWETPAERGLRLLRTQAYGKADFHISEFDRLWTVWPEEAKNLASELPAERRRLLTFERYGMIADPENPAGLPLGIVQTDEGGWVMNCLACHQGKVAGQVHWGVGNSHFAFQTLVDDLSKLARSAGKPPNPLLPFLPLGSSNGTTNAQIFSVFLTSLRDLELNRLTFPRLWKYQHHDLDAPPLWNVKHKKRLYIDGFVPKTHRIIMQFTLVPSNDADSIKSREEGFRDILAWIESLQAPKYPWAIDQDLAMKGQAVYERACAECHGTYGDSVDYPEIRIPLEEVGTDPVRLTGIPVEHRRFYRDSWFGNYGEIEIDEQPDGYVAPPLEGIWASAPYLHNGSVPTLWHLMNPSKRPSVWRRIDDASGSDGRSGSDSTADGQNSNDGQKGYDRESVGLQIEIHDRIPDRATSADEKRLYFDTRGKGKSAAGHHFPNALSDSEKWAVIEYLKTL
jgi:hypothetical protein